MPFVFRLTASCPPGYGLTVPEHAAAPRVVLAAGPIVVEVKVVNVDSQQKTPVILTGRGYSTEEDARAAGEDAKAALRASSVTHAVPLDLGDDQARTRLAPDFRQRLEREVGAQIRGDVHGLDVYEDDGRPVRTFSMSANATVSRGLDDFAASLEGFLERAPVLGPELTLAIDLFSLAMFEASERARFLTLVTALEVLSEQKPRADNVRLHVDQLMSLTQDAMQRASSPYEQQSFQSLLSSLADLRKQSITSAIRDLVRAHIPGTETFANVNAERFVSRCYAARSKLVHEGQDEAVTLTGELRGIVRAVLLGCIKETH